jgi:hypothetical protein
MTNQNDKAGLYVPSPKDLDIVSEFKERFGSEDGFYIAKEIPSVEAIELIEVVVNKFGAENAVMWLKRYFVVLGDRTPIEAYIQGDKAKVLACLDEWHVQDNKLGLIDPIENKKMEHKELRDSIVYSLLCLLFVLLVIELPLFLLVTSDHPSVSNNLPDRVELRSP